ncbi:MAG: cob(I)yrinic acid a,c-diamide adenosyltransferase [Candidatus Omnitrophica bacterium]|nr:cob(I)yrinic acid a,c-diamide adenosyltransferase [Candidatus Omnitrophota bacterium]
MAAKGLIHIYTGSGKGKTTAAVGLAVRAAARGWRVCYVSFHKSRRYYAGGEQALLTKIGVDVRRFAPSHPMCRTAISLALKQQIGRQCRRGLSFLMDACRSGGYDLVIADELNICVRDGFITETEVVALLQAKPAGMELVVTGRGASAAIIAAADVVSEIREIKHPFSRGIPARKGIDY